MDSKIGINFFKNSNKLSDITYAKDESSKEIIDILALKIYISKIIKTEKELITIFSKSSENTNKSKGLPDNFNVFEEKEKEENFNMSQSTSKDIKSLYYRICTGVPMVNLTVEINVDNNRRDLNLCVSGNCSIYMLKYNLAEDLNISKNSIELKNEKNNITYNDEQYLLDAYSAFINNLEEINEVKSCSSDDSNSNSFHNQINTTQKFKIILIQKLLKTKSKTINFFFNYMNEINKLKFQQEAPDYREASDGINILFYCKNSNCKINNEMFIHKLGK
jgi:hypothetical protein